jgi:lipid-A-disaccharide synthase-like uncharacterized protein
MIPRWFLLIIYIAATVACFAAARGSFERGNKSMGWALIGYGGGSLSAVTFYFALLFTEISTNPDVSIPWSRWVFTIIGMAMLSGGVSAYIVNKRGRDGTP